MSTQNDTEASAPADAETQPLRPGPPRRTDLTFARLDSDPSTRERRRKERVPERVAASVRRRLRSLADPRIVAIGAAYKPNTYDTRNSPAMRVVELLQEDGYRVDHYDPLAAGMEYPSLAAVCEGADCLLVLVEHDVVRDELAAHEAKIRGALRTPNIVRFHPQPANGGA